MKLFVTSIKVNLVTNWFLFLFFHFVWTKNKNNFLGNWWSGNEKYLLFVYSESHSTLKAYQIQETFTNGFSNMLLLFVYISVHISEATVVGLHIYQKKVTTASILLFIFQKSFFVAHLWKAASNLSGSTKYGLICNFWQKLSQNFLAFRYMLDLFSTFPIINVGNQLQQKNTYW